MSVQEEEAHTKRRDFPAGKCHANLHHIASEGEQERKGKGRDVGNWRDFLLEVYVFSSLGRR